MPGQTMIVPASFSRSMIRFTAIAAVMLSGTPVLCPSPWPGPFSMNGARSAMPGFCDVPARPSTSDPIAMTGFPLPQTRHPAGRHAGGVLLHGEAVPGQDLGAVALGLELLETQLAEAEDRVHHLLRQLLQTVDFGGSVASEQLQPRLDR